MTIEARNAIVAKMLTVPGIGNVHGFERYAKALADFAAIFTDTGRVIGWIVERVSWRDAPGSTTHTVIDYRWRIRGYMSLDDATQSELAFHALIDQLAAAFRADERLGDAVDTTIVDGRAGLQLDDAGNVKFAGILCHGARLSLVTRCTFEVGAEPGDDFALAGIEWDMIEPHDDAGGMGPPGDTDASDTVTIPVI